MKTNNMMLFLNHHLMIVFILTLFSHSRYVSTVGLPNATKFYFCADLWSNNIRNSSAAIQILLQHSRPIKSILPRKHSEGLFRINAE